MNDKQLVSLLKRFMDGTTTVDEETLLADFFHKAADDDRPDGISRDDWTAYRQMFKMFEASADSSADDGGQLPAKRRPRLWLLTGRVAAAAAVVLLVVGGFMLLPRHNEGMQPLARQTEKALPVDSFSDSVSAERPRRINTDSINTKENPKPTHRSMRPYWQPRPPKVYVAEADAGQDNNPADEPDNRQIDEAVRQAEALLKAINLHQAAELKQLDLQAMDNAFGSDDEAGDGDEGMAQ